MKLVQLFAAAPCIFFAHSGFVEATELYADLPDNLKIGFASQMLLKDGFDALPMQDASVSVDHRECNIILRSFDLLGMKISPTLNDDTVCTLEGEHVLCLDQRVEFKRLDDGTKITVSFDEPRSNIYDPNSSTDVNSRTYVSIQVIDECGIEYYYPVNGSSSLLVTIPDAAADIDNFLLENDYAEDNSRNRRTKAMKNLRTEVEHLAEQKYQLHRELPVHPACPNGPTSYINLGMVFESSYCSDLGGKEAAFASLERAVAGVSGIYEQATCTSIRLGRIEGWCGSDDPYTEFVATNKSGCGNEGLLTGFQKYWNENRVTERQDLNLVHLASGTGLECNSSGACVIGCAYISQLCKQSVTAIYGVNYMSFTRLQSKVDALLAHEMVSGDSSRLCAMI